MKSQIRKKAQRTEQEWKTNLNSINFSLTLERASCVCGKNFNLKIVLFIFLFFICKMENCSQTEWTRRWRWPSVAGDAYQLFSVEINLRFHYRFISSCWFSCDLRSKFWSVFPPPSLAQFKTIIQHNDNANDFRNVGFNLSSYNIHSVAARSPQFSLFMNEGRRKFVHLSELKILIVKIFPAKVESVRQPENIHEWKFSRRIIRFLSCWWKNYHTNWVGKCSMPLANFHFSVEELETF